MTNTTALCVFLRFWRIPTLERQKEGGVVQNIMAIAQAANEYIQRLLEMYTNSLVNVEVFFPEPKLALLKDLVYIFPDLVSALEYIMFSRKF